ncbi:hypothetical protein HYALB_00009842 [Hymenoscyphus albidus]|uniref:Hydrophobin n=1 Tax=Hymenoscyphus albidus TaxID=595503 RepID=A0A9N9QDP1_9HELO|nr:hypothetical protein HYALB_00009842 [Hymenoscyphus albidus]
MSLIPKTVFVILFATFLPATHAVSLESLGLVGHLVQPLPIADYPAPELVTNHPSTECEKINGGSRLCCQSTFDGGVPLVKELAPIIGFRLNHNSVNGIYCKKDAECAVGEDLCCQVDSFPNVIPTLLNLAMYCQSHPAEMISTKPSTPPKAY